MAAAAPVCKGYRAPPSQAIDRDEPGSAERPQAIKLSVSVLSWVTASPSAIGSIEPTTNINAVARRGPIVIEAVAQPAEGRQLHAKLQHARDDNRHRNHISLCQLVGAKYGATHHTAANQKTFSTNGASAGTRNSSLACSAADTWAARHTSAM